MAMSAVRSIVNQVSDTGFHGNPHLLGYLLRQIRLGEFACDVRVCTDHMLPEFVSVGKTLFLILAELSCDKVQGLRGFG